MPQVNIHAAKTHLSKLLERVAAGEEVIIAKAGKPVARLVPFEAAPVSGMSPAKRRFGALKGRIWMAPNFDEPLEEFLPSMADCEDDGPTKPAITGGEPPSVVDRVAGE